MTSAVSDQDQKKKAAEAKMRGKVRKVRARVDLRYDRTIRTAIWSQSKAKFKYVEQRIGTHKAAKNAKIDDYRKADDAKWGQFNTEMTKLQNLLQLEEQSLLDIHNRIIDIQYDDFFWANREIREPFFDADAMLMQLIELLRHNGTYYQTLKKETSAALADLGHKGSFDDYQDADARIPQEIFTQYRQFAARATAELTFASTKLGTIRERLQQAVTAAGFVVEADLQEEKDGTTEALETTERVFHHVQAAAEFVPVLVPEETVASVFDGANAIGVIIQDAVFSRLRRRDLRRRAKEISQDPKKRAMAIARLNHNPLSAAEFIRKQRKEELEISLNKVNLPVTGTLMGVSAALGLTGVGAIVAKVVLPFVWPCTREAIIGIFDTMEATAIEKAKSELEELTGGDPEYFARLDNETLIYQLETLSKSVDESYTSLKDALEQDRKKVEDDIMRRTNSKAGGWNPVLIAARKLAKDLAKENAEMALDSAKDDGIGNLSLPGLIALVRKVVVSVLPKVLQCVPMQPAQKFTGLDLLTRIYGVGQQTKLERAMNG